ncbi:LOW QUALITY PROTEIN: PE family protein, partial [Mycobacterium tuberculosis T92]
MSFVTIQPVVLAAATGDLPTIGTAVSARNTAVCAPTTGVLPPAANDVSVLTAARFTAHTKHYRVVSKPAALGPWHVRGPPGGHRRCVCDHRGRQCGRDRL